MWQIWKYTRSENSDSDLITTNNVVLNIMELHTYGLMLGSSIELWRFQSSTTTKRTKFHE